MIELILKGIPWMSAGAILGMIIFALTRTASDADKAEPMDTILLNWLEENGFGLLYNEKVGQWAVFDHDGKPTAASADPRRAVLRAMGEDA